MADEQLQEAIKTLQAGRREEARRQLMVLLRQNPEDENAWLVLSAAVDDPVRRRQALETVLEINPENSIAQTQLGKLEPTTSPPAPSIEESEPEPVAELGEIEAGLADFDEGEPEVAPAEVAPAEEAETQTGRRRLLFLATAGMLLLCLFVILALLLLDVMG